MSRIDDNPFGDPIDNPFADPAVVNIARNNPNVQTTIEEYNPFEDQFVPQSKPQHTSVNIDNPAPVVQTSSQNIPHQSQPNRNVPEISTEEFERRKEELDRKTAELDRRERELQGIMPRLNNWPPLPDKCCFQPCFYQDFNVDIPSEFQRVVKNLYYAWMFYTLTMCTNIIGGLIILFHSGTFTTFGLSLFYCFLFTPASYLCWFRPAYKAFRSDSSFNFMIFFFVYFFQTIITVFQTIGVPETGYCGFIMAIKQFDTKSVSSVFVGILLLLVAFCFAICAAANILMITKVHAIYRSSGASVAKAQAEFTNEFMRNQHIQQAATSAMTSAVNSQLNSRY